MSSPVSIILADAESLPRVPQHGKRYSLSPDEQAALIERAMKLYDQGASIREVGEAIGRPYTSTYRLLAANGAKFRSRGGPNNPYGNLGEAGWRAAHEAQAGGSAE